jgi:hypothetical protein
VKPQVARGALLAIVATCLSATVALMIVKVGQTPPPPSVRHAPPSFSQVSVSQSQSATSVTVEHSQVDVGQRVYIVQPGGMRG